MDSENLNTQTPSHQQSPQGGAPQHYSTAGSSVVQQPAMPHHVTVMRQAGEPKGLSVASMVIGFVLGLVGLKKEPAGRGMAITGVVLSGLILAIWAVLIFSGIGLLGIGLYAAATASGHTIIWDGVLADGTPTGGLERAYPAIGAFLLIAAGSAATTAGVIRLATRRRLRPAGNRSRSSPQSTALRSAVGQN